jgi:hypothetical protein
MHPERSPQEADRPRITEALNDSRGASGGVSIVVAAQRALARHPVTAQSAAAAGIPAWSAVIRSVGRSSTPARPPIHHPRSTRGIQRSRLPTMRNTVERATRRS